MNLVERVKAILLTPKTEWPVIAREPGDVAYLFQNYVAILAAIPAVCGFLGGLLRGAPFFRSLLFAVIGYVLTFVMVYVVALIVDALAPTFNAQKGMDNALKLTVYSATPYWVTGIFLLIPALGILTLLGLLYGLYLMWLGLPVLMKAPEDKAPIYLGAIVVAIIVIWVLLFFVGLRYVF